MKYPRGRRVAPEDAARALDLAQPEARAATWRGWLLGLLFVAVISLIIPYFDFVLRGTMFSNNMFPASSVFFLFGLVGLVSLGLSRFRTALGLTRPDLVLVFCMTFVVNAIPGCGFWAFWVGETTGGFFRASPENRFGELVLPHVPPSWSPHDTALSRPLEWFYTGLPPGETIPWGAWVGPYAIWCAALLMLFGILFALCGLLRRHWSEREQLAFPLAQLPEEMLQGLYGGPAKPFLSDRLAWWGIGATLLFHSWNNLGDYIVSFPRIPQGANLQSYLTEPPWNALLPMWTYIYPSVIGLTFLLPLEVSFSLWFYFIVLKLSAFWAVRAGALPLGGAYWNTVFMDQGTGALLALALGLFWMARRDLGGTFLQALGLRPAEENPSDFSARVLWLLLVGCSVGSVAWLVWAGVGVGWAVLLLALLVVAMTGLTRLSCEGGLFFMQMGVFPMHLLSLGATPSVLGVSNFVKLTVWDRVLVADWFRVVFMPNIMNSLHLASRTGLRRRSLMLGLGAAILLALGVSFGSFLYTAYHHPGGAIQMAWYFNGHPRRVYSRMAATASKIKRYEEKVEQARAAGHALPEAEVPDVARRDWSRIFWLGFGAAFMVLSLVLRQYIFWFPHPIGYAMWTGPYPNLHLWFSFFLGWMIKFAILKYGGSRIYLRGKRFFIGVVVGEAVATVLWKLVAAWQHNVGGYNMLPG